MNLDTAKTLARSEMDRHGLSDYTLDMNYQMSTTFGRCNYQKKIISLSVVLVHLNSEEKVLDTIHHEIAHAIREKERGPVSYRLTPGAWHDYRWKQIASSLGASPHQFYNSPGNKHQVVTGKVSMPLPWRKTCPNCGISGLSKMRSKNKCCGNCVRNFGVYYNWTYTPNK